MCGAGPQDENYGCALSHYDHGGDINHVPEKGGAYHIT